VGVLQDRASETRSFFISTLEQRNPMESSTPTLRLTGVLAFWHLSRGGGFGKVFVPSTKEMFFIYRRLIVSGLPMPGSTVTFMPIPTPEGRMLREAGEAVIDNRRVARALDVPCYKEGA
jgi:hypothetical protein